MYSPVVVLKIKNYLCTSYTVILHIRKRCTYFVTYQGLEMRLLANEDDEMVSGPQRVDRDGRFTEHHCTLARKYSKTHI